MKLITTVGLPGSGKSTWAKEYAKQNKNFVRINRDDLRNMRGDYWIPKQEDLITAWEDNCIFWALKQGYSVILDSTNMSMDRNRDRNKKLKLLFPDLNFEFKTFDTSIEECIKRDLARPNSVGEKVIRGMYEKYNPTPVVKYKEDTSLPHCVIFDVDGTLASMNGRSPFDWSRVGEDSVKEPIANLLRTLHAAGNKVIIFTGRDGICLPETKDWLNSWDIPYDDIFIREQGSNEKDSIIKKKLFEENVRGKYYCTMVVDDRDSVVRMWREELGLTCLQVDYGNF